MCNETGLCRQKTLLNLLVNMEATRSSETLVTYHITTRCPYPEENNLNLHCRKKIKSRNR